jgi:metal-sulfur cluster biosynthetic enzyme
MSPEELGISLGKALDGIVDPCSIATGVPINLREMGLVKSFGVEDGHAHVTLRLTSPFCWQATNIVGEVERGLGEVEGVVSVTCEIDPAADWMPDMMAEGAQTRLRRARPLATHPK